MAVSYRPGRNAQLVVTGSLDAIAAAEVCEALDELLHSRPKRILLDLRRLTRFTDAGIKAMSDCVSRGRLLENGVGIRVATEAGRAVLLRSMERV